MEDLKNEVTDLMVMGDIIGVTERPKSLEHGTAGLEGIRADEMKLPRLAIAQGLSPQLVPDDAKYIPGLVIGQMFNDVTGTVYGSGPITVVPVFRKVERLQFDPDNKKVVIARDIPYDDPRMKWTKSPNGDVPPLGTEYVEFICLVLQPGKAPDKVVVSIKTTNSEQRDAARTWTTYIGLRGEVIYSGMYQLTTKIARGKNKKGEPTMYGHFVVKNAFFIPKDSPSGLALFTYAELFRQQLLETGYNVNREGAEDPDPDDFNPAKYEEETAASKI